METDIFTLILSPGEMFFLARLNGLERLSLPDDPYQWWLMEDIQTDIDQGATSLEERNLVRRISSTTWEADSSLGGIITWIALPDISLVINSKRQGTDDIDGVVYFKEGKCLLLELEEHCYHLTIYRKDILLQVLLLSWCGIDDQKATGDSFRFSKKVICHQLNQFKSDPQATILERTESLADWLEEVRFITSLTILSWHGQSVHEYFQMILLGNILNLWTVTIGQKETEDTLLTIIPISSEEATTKVLEIFSQMTSNLSKPLGFK